MSLWSRRSVTAMGVAGLAAPHWTASASAMAPRKLFETGPWARNGVAQCFERVSGAVVPPLTTLVSASGPHKFSDLRGKTRLVSLWAEWCVACLTEMPDLLALQQQFGGPEFEILAILTNSYRKLDLAGAAETLGRVKTSAIPLWIEPNGGKTLFDSLASPSPHHGTLPCTLLIDLHGHVRGRAFGMPTAMAQPAFTKGDIVSGKLTEAGRAKVMRAEAAAGIPTGELTGADKARMLVHAGHTLWSTADGIAFARALASGNMFG